jgi:TOTE conflict system, Archaeo-Eukaryotic Primase domain
VNVKLIASQDAVASYRMLFVNRLAYTLQSPKPNPKTGRHYYFRPKDNEAPVPLSNDVIKCHLEGMVTIGLYAINPATQRCKWLAIDADYGDALDDLLKLQWELRQDGVEAAFEKSRRGGHLWIFASQPLLARQCRLYISAVARRLKVPLKTAGSGDGIEVFPKQDELPASEFGNALRGPLGIHRATGKRYFFYGADYTLDAQLAYLQRLKRLTEDELAHFVAGLQVEEPPPVPKQVNRSYVPDGNSTHREFRILEHVTVRRKAGRNYWARCPSCARQNRDRAGDNLAISIADPRKYKCWAGCDREQIRAALGCPIRHGSGRRADGGKYAG